MLRKPSVFDEISTFIADVDPEKVANFRPSSAHQQRLDFLLDKQRKTGLVAEEKTEVEQYRIVGLAKARAIKMLES